MTGIGRVDGTVTVEKVACTEVESVLSGHPAVADVAVIGVPDDGWVETIRALVVPAPGRSATEAQLIEYCAAGLARHKVPASVEFRDMLARTAAGALRRFVLREPYWHGPLTVSAESCARNAPAI